MCVSYCYNCSLLSSHLDQNLASETAAYLTTKHPDYAVLAARIAISNLHKETKKNFSQVIKDLYNYGSLCSKEPDVCSSLAVNPKNGRPAGMISKEIYDVVCENAELLDSAIIYNRDFNYNLSVPALVSPCCQLIKNPDQFWIQDPRAFLPPSY
jgi:hypothetical protein